MKKLYMCGTDWSCELTMGADARVYPSLASLKQNKCCWQECGIVSVMAGEAKTVRVGYVPKIKYGTVDLLPGDLKRMKPPSAHSQAIENLKEASDQDWPAPAMLRVVRRAVEVAKADPSLSHQIIDGLYAALKYHHERVSERRKASRKPSATKVAIKPKRSRR